MRLIADRALFDLNLEFVDENFEFILDDHRNFQRITALITYNGRCAGALAYFQVGTPR